MKIDRELVLYIAKLARIELNEQEISLFAGQLQKILDYIDELKEVQADVEPFTYAHLTPALRVDEVKPSLSVEESLANAPERVKQFFKVPRIIP